MLGVCVDGYGRADVALHELDVWSDTHDPILLRRPWSSRNKRGNDVVNHLADEFAEGLRRFASDDDHDFAIGDLHGRWQLPTREYWDRLTADYAILVRRYPVPEDETIAYPQRIGDWTRFLAEFGIPVRHEVWSLREGQAASPYPWIVRDLDRHIKTNDPVIHELADSIIADSKG